MISFRSLKASDFPTMLEWLQRPHVKEWWDDGDDTLKKVADHYSSDPDTTFRYMVITGGGIPVGYIQYYMEREDVVGIDLFIGEPDLLDQGLGTEIVAAFVELVDSECGPRAIVIDPDPNNTRAIRCYEKAGFHFERIGTNAEGKGVYFMKLDRHVS